MGFSRHNCFQTILWPAIALLLLGMNPGISADQVKFEQTWRIEQIFKSPESVIYDSKRNVLYVSNVNGYERNGKGFLSKLSPQGDVLDLAWLTGINAPTGMGILDDKLYVANYDELLVVDLETEKIIARYSGPNAVPQINDVAISPEGQVFVSASRIAAIYKLEDGRLNVLIQDNENLRDANGLLFEGNSLVSAAWNLRKIDLDTLEITEINTSKKLEDMDGISADGRGGYFISPIGNHWIFHLDSNGKVRVVHKPGIYIADFVFVEELQTIFAAGGNNSVSAFKLVRK